MKFIDLFAGIGGFRYGLEKANQNKQLAREITTSRRHKPNNNGGLGKNKNEWFVCVYSNEYNKYASQIYKKHYGECDTRDIRTVKVNEIPDHDLLCAGFPCQSFSIAGKRKGFEDTRGTLFFEIARIAKHKRPRYLLLENVKGLLSHEQGKTFQTIIGVLADLGYGVEWQVLNSKHFGVPQNRERVFIVGHLGGIGERKVFPIGENGEFSDKEQQQPIFREIQTRKQKDSSNANRKDAQNGKNGQLHYIGGIEGKRKKWLEDGKDNSRNFSQGQRVYSDKGISSTLAGNAGGLGGKTGLYQIDMKIRRLTPTECERLQGFPDGWTEGISDTQRYKCLGNAVTTNVIEAIGKKLIWLTINKKEL